MIPFLAMVRMGGRRRTFRFWLPLFLLWPLLLPFVALLAIVALLARAYGAAFTEVLRTGWQLVSGWRGAHIQVDSPGFAFRVRFI